MSTPDTQMNQYLTTIAEAVHGRDMRAAIHDGMEKTYNDSYAWFNQSLGNANQALQKATEALEIAEPMGDDIQEIKDLAEDLDTKYDETNERVNNIIAHNQDTQGNSELIDLRTTYDGQIKTSAGTAVRSQISNLHSRINNLVREQSTGELEDCHAKPVYVPLYENQYPSSAFAAQTLQLSLPGSPVPSLAKYAFIKITFKDSNLFGAGVRSVYIPNPGKDAEATNIYTSDGHVTMPADGTYGLNSYSRKFTAALSSNDTVLNIMFTDCEKIATDNPFAIDNSDMTISDPSSTTTTDNEYLIPYEVFLIDYVLDGEIEIDKDTELIDIRNGEDGTTYQSAGAAVRGQVVSAKNKTASTQSMIAPLYSVSGTYAAGDYVNYGDKLYKAKQAISSEAWTASHWDEVNVMDEVDSDVGELKSALTLTRNNYDGITENPNLFNIGTVTRGYRLGTSGQATEAEGYFISAYIPVTVNDTYYKNSPSEDAYHRICMYSGNTEADFISASNSNELVVSNSSAEYVRFCGLISELETTNFHKGTTSAFDKVSRNNESGINITDMYLNRRIETDGVTVDITDLTINSDYFCIAVPCSEGDKFLLSGKTRTSKCDVYLFINNSYEPLSIRSGSNTEVKNKTVIAPENAAYLVYNTVTTTDGYLTKLQPDSGTTRYVENRIDEVNATIQSESYLQKRRTEAEEYGFKTSHDTPYAIGEIDGSGDIDPSVTKRIYSTEFDTFDHNDTIGYIIQPQGARSYVCRFNNNGTFKSRDSLGTAHLISFTIVANEKYKYVHQMAGEPTITSDNFEEAVSEFHVMSAPNALNDIVGRNKDKEVELLQLTRNQPAHFEPQYKPLVFAHFSDIHSQKPNWKNICKYLNYWKDVFAFAIHTGDIVGTYQGDNADLYSIEVPLTIPIFNIVGNHDTYKTYTPTQTLATKAETYQVVFGSANISDWDVIWGSGENDMYYYKDFDDEGIRLICLDPYYWNATEATWFENLLADARTNNLAVITAAHERGAEVTNIGSTFYTLDPWDRPLSVTAFYPYIVNFVQNGGVHIIHLCGHFHHDKFGLTLDNILVSQIECATSNNHHTDTVRGFGAFASIEKSFDCFNAMQVDRSTGTVKIVRIGVNSDEYLQGRNVLCYDFVNRRILSNY